LFCFLKKAKAISFLKICVIIDFYSFKVNWQNKKVKDKEKSRQIDTGFIIFNLTLLF